MKKIAREKSLLNQTSSKSKKQDKYSEISDIKKEFKFPMEGKAIFVGLPEEYRYLECTIIKRSNRKSTEYYKIKFDNDNELEGISGGFLKTLEEYELLLEQSENKCEDDMNDISDVERKILETGLIPMKNEKSCHNQEMLYHRSCEQCGYEPVCIYWKKWQYDKIKFN